MQKITRPDTGSLSELAGVLAGAMLCGIALIAHAQTTAPPTVVGADGKPRIPVAEKPMVLADPDTRMYSVCTTGDEHDPPASGEHQRPPKAEVITEEQAKARGYRAGAHKASCK